MIDQRWQRIRAVYLILFGAMIAASAYFQGRAFPYFLTNHMLTVVFVTLLLSRFRRTEALAHGPLVVVALGYVWLVVTGRVGLYWAGAVDFIRSGTWEMPPALYGAASAADTIVHILPVLCIYQLFYALGPRRFGERFAALPVAVRILAVFAPVIGVSIWASLVDPAKQYYLELSIPRWTLPAIAFGISTLGVAPFVYALRKQQLGGWRADLVESLAFVVLLVALGLGWTLGGASFLAGNFMSWSTVATLALLAIRRIPGWRTPGTAWLFLPVYGVLVISVLMSEAIVALDAGAHRRLLHGIAYDAKLNAFLFLGYTGLFLLGSVTSIMRIALTELCEDGATPVVRRWETASERYGPWPGLWQAYGALVLCAAYYVAQRLHAGDTVSFKWHEVLILGVLAVVLCQIPRSLYRALRD